MTEASNPPFISFGPRVRKSPFFEATLRYGAKAFTVYNHTYMPTVYSDPVTEYWSLINDVTLWDVSCQRQIEISGPDAFRFIQLLTPRDMSRCQTGQCQYMVITDQFGGIVNDAVMLRIQANQYWLSPGDGDVLLWAQGVAVNCGMDVRVTEPDVSVLQLQGPRSPQTALALFGDSILDLKYYRLRETMLGDIPLVISRTGWSGELGYEIYLRDGRFGEALWEQIMNAGKPYSIAPAAPSVIRSVEGGLLSYVSDISREDNPFAMGMEHFINLRQPDDFIGKEALKSIQASGAQRRLAGIEIAGEALKSSNEEFWPVLDGDDVIGHVTRCVFSPRLEKNIGYANVPVLHSEIGTSLILRSPDGDRTATVCNAPWFPAQKKFPVRSGSGITGENKVT